MQVLIRIRIIKTRIKKKILQSPKQIRLRHKINKKQINKGFHNP